jgi:hypothetical protein
MEVDLRTDLREKPFAWFHRACDYMHGKPVESLVLRQWQIGNSSGITGDLYFSCICRFPI